MHAEKRLFVPAVILQRLQQVAIQVARFDHIAQGDGSRYVGADEVARPHPATIGQLHSGGPILLHQDPGDAGVAQKATAMRVEVRCQGARRLGAAALDHGAVMAAEEGQRHDVAGARHVQHGQIGADGDVEEHQRPHRLVLEHLQNHVQGRAFH